MTLREKLKALTAPSREVDAEIAVIFEPDKKWAYDPMDEHGPRNFSPYYTSSLDATVDLVEREMPLGDWQIRRDVADYASLIVDRRHLLRARHTLPAIALLLALLDAKGIE